MAKFAGGSTYNFGLAVSGQTNGFFIPEVYSKKVQIALRKAAVAEGGRGSVRLAVCSIRRSGPYHSRKFRAAVDASSRVGPQPGTSLP